MLRFRFCLLLAAISLLPSTQALAGFEFSVFNPTGGGSFVLGEGAGQTVDIFITSTAADPLGSFELNVQIGNGVGGASEPIFTGVSAFTGPGYLATDVAGTWAPGGPAFPPPGTPNSEMQFTLTNFGAPTSFIGTKRFATLTVDTTGFGGQGPFAFAFSNSAGPSLVNDPGSVTYAGTLLSGGSFTVAAVPEPATLGLVGLGVVAAGAAKRRFRRKQVADVTSA